MNYSCRRASHNVEDEIEIMKHRLSDTSNKTSNQHSLLPMINKGDSKLASSKLKKFNL